MKTPTQSAEILKNFVAPRQLSTLLDLAAHCEEKDYFIETLDEMATRIDEMPHTYQQDGKGDQAIAYLHYFRGSGDWYITEKDMGDGSGDLTQYQAFGLADLGYGPEFGYIGIEELKQCNVEIDLHFTPKPIGEIKQSH